MKRPLQLLVLQRAGSGQQPVEAVKRRQQVQEVAEQRPRHRHRQQQQRVDDLTQHAASCRHVDHIWTRESREIRAPENYYETLHESQITFGDFDEEDMEVGDSPAVMVSKKPSQTQNSSSPWSFSCMLPFQELSLISVAEREKMSVA